MLISTQIVSVVSNSYFLDIYAQNTVNIWKKWIYWTFRMAFVGFWHISVSCQTFVHTLSAGSFVWLLICSWSQLFLCFFVVESQIFRLFDSETVTFDCLTSLETLRSQSSSFQFSLWASDDSDDLYGAILSFLFLFFWLLEVFGFYCKALEMFTGYETFPLASICFYTLDSRAELCFSSCQLVNMMLLCEAPYSWGELQIHQEISIYKRTVVITTLRWWRCCVGE